MKDEALDVSILTIENFMGIKHAVIRPGEVTVIEGENGQGKSTIIDAFKEVVRGGNDAKLIRNGEEKAELVMVLSDGTEIDKEMTHDDATTKIRSGNGRAISSPATYLNNIRDLFSTNPVEFLTAKDDKQLQIFLSAIPLRIMPIDVTGILELCSESVDFERHALQVISFIDKDLFDQRAGFNRQFKEKKTTAEQMRRTLPAGSVTNVEGEDQGPNWSQVREGLEANYRSSTTNDAQQETEVVKAVQVKVDRVKTETQTTVQLLIDARDREIDRISSECQKHIEWERDAMNNTVTAYNKEKDDDLAALRKEASTRNTQFEEKIAEARANAKVYEQAEGARAHVKQLDDDAAALDAKSRQYTDALAQLDKLKGNLLEDLPIKGVTLKDGGLAVDGVPWKIVNTARKVRIAVEVAALRMGRLQFLCVDGAESLDSNNLAELKKTAKAKKIKLIMGIAKDGPLRIRTLRYEDKI